MKCPTCPDSTLALSDRQGIEIDYCPACRGVWLDRGELDKLIERATADVAPARAAPREREDDRHDRRDDRPRRDDDDHYRGGYRKSKRKSILGEIFDF